MAWLGLMPSVLAVFGIDTTSAECTASCTLDEPSVNFEPILLVSNTIM